MIYTFEPFGYEGNLVQVETDFREVGSDFNIVGIKENMVENIKNDVRSGIKNQGFDFPISRVLISLLPCDLCKYNNYSLPIALSILERSLGLYTDKKIFVYGKLNMSGNLDNYTRELYASIQFAEQNEMEYIIIPEETSEPYPLFPKVKTYPAQDLKECIAVLRKIKQGEF